MDSGSVIPSPMMLSPSLNFGTWSSRCRHSCVHAARASLAVGSRGQAKRFASSASGSSSSEGSSSSPPYPYPPHRNPTPHQIFHLPRNASEADIKARYFDLVRIYHPDKASDVPPDIAHSRFQAITRAYDALRGKVASGSTDDGSPANPSVDLRYQTTAAWRAAHRRRQQELYSTGAVDDKWKDRIIMFGVVSTIVFVIANTLTTRREVMAEALNRTREVNTFQKDQRQQLRVEEEARLAAEPDPGDSQRLKPQS